MNSLNHLGMRVAGITALALVVLFGLWWGGRALIQRGQGPAGAPTSLTLAERQQDSDGDGVADLYETSYYNTDPAKADTDGDGVSDLEEILAGRDPLTAGPADESRPATGSTVAGRETFTQRYLASLPEDIPREDILDQARLEAFINANRGVLLPNVAPESIKTSPAAGTDAIRTYLDAIASTHNPSLKAVTSTDIEAAFRLRVNSSQAQPLEDLVIALTNNVGVLENVAAPAEAAALHTKLIAASRSLRDNTAGLRDVQNDFVGGLIAAKNIESLGAIFQEIAQDVAALEAKYGIE